MGDLTRRCSKWFAWRRRGRTCYRCEKHVTKTSWVLCHECMRYVLAIGGWTEDEIRAVLPGEEENK